MIRKASARAPSFSQKSFLAQPTPRSAGAIARKAISGNDCSGWRVERDKKNRPALSPGSGPARVQGKLGLPAESFVV